MAATVPSATSTPPTPPTSLPAFARITSASVLQRNASTSSSRSTTTSESTSSLVAVPIRPPPIQTRTAATPEAQLPSESASGYISVDSEPGGGLYGGRGFLRQGPRMARQATLPSSPPTFVPTSPSQFVQLPERSPSLPPNISMSPTTPKAKMHRLPVHKDTYPVPPQSPGPIRVTVATGDGTHSRRPSSSSNPATPTYARKPRSVNDIESPLLEPRERRSSQVSTHSNGSSSSKRPSLRDFVLGEELGRGSYSTVVQASQTSNPRIPHDVAIKVMNQYHLIQEKKAKYAHIERDALIRLAQPRAALSPTLRTHRRGVSSSSSNGGSAAVVGRKSANGSLAVRRDSTSNNSPNGVVMASPTGGLRDRSLADGPSPRSMPIPLSPLVSTSMRLAKSGDSQSQEVLDERPRTPGFSSRPPSPVQEEPCPELGSSSESEQHLHPQARRNSATAADGRPRTPRKRRQSAAHSERSATSSGGTASQVIGHPGVIHLYCTFADKTSVYYVLELASNGELASSIRQHGSLDLESARFYAAQLIDTIEYIHDRDIIHRDLKPENILLDKDMRIKVTDFGSAKILGRKEEPSETSKRSFVGSADYVSPEVLSDQPVSTASDIWGFGVCLYNFIAGKTPFRSATEFLTFQKVLHREFTYPDGFDEQGKSLIDSVLDLDPTKRPTVQEIKAHPFFSTIDWGMLWQVTPPTIHTGMSPPQQAPHMTLDSEVWAAFEDDDDSDGDIGSSPVEGRFDERFGGGVQFPRHESPEESTEDLDPPRPVWLDEEGPSGQTPEKKVRGWSTSSSSSGGGRLSVWLESMGINTPPGRRAGSSRASRYSDRSDDRPRLDEGTRSPRTSRSRATSPAAPRILGVTSADNTRWMPLMVANERIILSTPVMTKADSSVPSFLLPVSKRRQLILTDLPRLLEVKDDPELGPKIKHEFAFLNHPRSPLVPASATGTVRSTNSSPRADSSDLGPLYILEVQEKASKAFVLQTPTQAFTFAADTTDVRAAWMHMLRQVVKVV